MVIVKPTPKNEGGNYLKPDFAKKELLRRIRPVEEMTKVESEYEGEKQQKITGKVECDIAGKPIKIWSMNATCKNSLITIFGPDTKNWMKPIQILVMPISGHDSILVDEVGTMELNGIKPKPQGVLL